MLNTNEFEGLKNLIISSDAQDWHWHGKGCIFDTVKYALHKLHRANDPRVHEFHILLVAKQVVYGDDAGNTVPGEFLKYLGGKLSKSRVYLTKKGNLKGKPYLESFKGDEPKGYVDGFVETL